MSLAEEARRRLKVWAAMTGNCVLVGDAPASDSDSEAESPRPAGPHPVATASAAVASQEIATISLVLVPGEPSRVWSIAPDHE